MNNEIQRFDFKGASLRTLTDEAGEPWFVAKDACDILELNNVTEALRPLDDDEKSNFRNSEVAQNGGRAPLIISEPGLYKLIMRSRKPEAHEFQRWVTHEVLPQIRRTGGYIPATDADDDMTILAKAVMIGQRTMEQQQRKIAEQQTRIVELEPKARFADAVAASDGTCLVGELAKMLRQNGMDIGQNRLFRLLQADGYLGKSGSNRNVPTQRAMDLGLFRIKETTVTHADGHTTVSRTPKVTGKGQRYFIDRYWGRAQPSLEAGA
ncbi:phage antirepressor KilAC domain-containing protein [Bifidobacterium adolescentis]|jgi:anti-repressor protein|uniref:phage antirepressor n=1 Tax=Bifidobacterium adolescentis TaxID=1680 RepID=UPI00189BF4D0|nr:phage antirepressor KilAC domain-containing protein [Bifidobacterium adolescentis]MDB1547619.1 phage antirepressor KilAC domain-containing protein [Bifidobacterium adolescentis]MDB1555731.1 phage antirepressor KilAC domain-containing protein [Bifidobacterium adolescentis]